jgi:hypothetical protein
VVAHFEHPLTRLQRVARLVQPYPPRDPIPGAGEDEVGLDAARRDMRVLTLKVSDSILIITYLRAERGNRGRRSLPGLATSTKGYPQVSASERTRRQ